MRTVTTPVAWAKAREQSFIMVKPDGVHRGLVADIIKRFEARGYKLVGIKVSRRIVVSVPAEPIT